MFRPIIEASREMQFRGKARLLNLIGPRSGVNVTSVFGSTFDLDLSDFIQRQIYFGTFEPHETRVVRNYLKPGMIFVDVGANVGYFTALAASIVGKAGRVISFEPSPYAFNRLRAMVEKSGLSQVSLVPAGLGDAPGELNIYLGIGSDNHSPTMIAHEGTTATVVAVKKLDDALGELGCDRIDFMKIDVEGFEPRVLAGATQLLREGRIRSILCEFNEHWLAQAGSSPAELRDLICNAGLVESDTGGRENRYFRLP
jgi:FkbM family methyltransferase